MSQEIIANTENNVNETLDLIISETRAKQTPKGWQGHCPAHNDYNPSLSIAQGDDGRILLNCFTGCETEDVAEALGLEMHQLFPDSAPTAYVGKWKGEEVTDTYVYKDENRKPLYRVLRTEKKNFPVQHLDENGKWVWGLGDMERVLYRLPELKKANKWVPVYVVEGEKDVETLREMGFIATTSMGGGGKGKGKWLPECYNEALRGLNVVIIPDNDKAGREYEQLVGSSIQGIAASVKVIHLEGLEDKGDVSDWFAQGHTCTELTELTQNAEKWKPEVAAAVKPTEKRQAKSLATLLETELPAQRWAIPSLLPEGLTILAGKPKMGKSWLVLDIALAVASGTHAVGNIPTVKGDVLYMALEDSERRIQTRTKLLLKGKPHHDLTGFKYETRWGSDGMEFVEDWLNDHKNARLVVIDTLGKIAPPSKANADQYKEAYAFLGRIKELADRFNVAILVVDHTRKSAADDPLEEVQGSIGKTGTADSIMVLKRDRGKADATLHMTGRDIEEKEIALKLGENQQWTHMGDAEEFRISDDRQTILDAVGNGYTTTKDICLFLPDKNEGAVKVLLGRMVDDGQLKRPSKGRYTLPLSSNHNVKNNNDDYVTTVTTVTGVTCVAGVTHPEAVAHVTDSNKVTLPTKSVLPSGVASQVGSKQFSNEVTQVTQSWNFLDDEEICGHGIKTADCADCCYGF